MRHLAEFQIIPCISRYTQLDLMYSHILTTLSTPDNTGHLHPGYLSKLKFIDQRLQVRRVDIDPEPFTTLLAQVSRTI